MAATPLADHASCVAAALKDLDEAKQVEERLLHEARRIATEIKHHQARTCRLRERAAEELAATYVAIGVT